MIEPAAAKIVGKIGKARVVDPAGGARQRPAIGERQGFEPGEARAGGDAERAGEGGGGGFAGVAEQAAFEGARLPGETLGKAGAAADAIAEAAGVFDKAAAALFGAHHALLLQHRQRPAHGVAVGGKALRQRCLAAQPVAGSELAADDVEAEGVGDPAPQGDAAERAERRFRLACHLSFMLPF